MAATSPGVTTVFLLLVVFVGGFLGGTIDLLHKIAYRGGKFYLYDEAYSRATFSLLILRSGLVGIGGALALCAVRIYAKEIEQYLDMQPQHILYNFSLSMIAGFAARTLLPNIANILERRLQEQDLKIAAQSQTVSEQATEIEQTRAELQKQQDEMDARSKEFETSDKYFLGNAALNPGAVRSDITRAKSGLEDLLREHPTARRAAIMLARIIHEKEDDVDGAIKVLSDFLANNETTNIPDRDTADVLYNKSCYLAMKAARLQKEGAASTEIDTLRKEAILALERSISLSPANASDAAGDQDLASIRDMEQFQQIVRSV